MKPGYPSYDVYRDLYRRYYDGRDVGELLDLLQPLAGTLLLDLCGGEGRLTLEALDRGAERVILVDREASMIAPEVSANPQVRARVETVIHALRMMRRRGATVNRIACRQAVTYWLDKTTASLLADVLSAQGVFAFNTFNQEPPTKPRVLQYDLDDHSFTEVSWLVGDIVHHLQVRDGMEPHHTSFRWLPRAELHLLLEPYFLVTENVRGKTSLYRCEKR